MIEDDAHGDVEAAGVRFDPREDGLDFHESLEGMLVVIARPQVAGPRTSFGELPVLARGAARPRTRRGGVLVRRGDFNPERLILDDELARDARRERRRPAGRPGARGRRLLLRQLQVPRHRAAAAGRPASAAGADAAPAAAPSWRSPR